MSDQEDSAAHWRLVDRCFDEVLDAPESSREALLISMLEKYPRPVVSEVRELVAALGATHSVFDQPAAAQVNVSDTEHDRRPERVGRWEIREHLASGGQGRVYVATKQAEQFEQTGALKLISDHFSSAAMQRFLRERQTLAQLRHPNIAVLLDAGASEEGHPYLVSELIRGKTLDHYIDTHDLSMRECVQLLLPVVDAVAYAHQQLVLHRDIKPANVIVDEDDVPFLLDFGVSAALAGATSEEANDETLAPYTPSYGAPEQIRGGPVDVRTDCWGLGALLYRALAGRSPFAAKDADHAIEAVLHETPPPPCADAELNAIVAKCLEKPIERRYKDVGQLRDDLMAWLDDAPVRAATTGRRYLLGKWFRRHKTLAAAGSLLALSLLIGVAVSTYQAQRAAAQRDRAAAEAQKFETAVGLLADVFNGANPAQNRGQSPSADDLLAAAYSRVTEMEDRPGVRAALAIELAAVYLNRAEPAKAAELSALTVGQLEASGEARSEYYANSLVTLATAEKMLGRYPESAELLERSLHVQRAHLWSPDDWRYAYTQNMLGTAQTLMGDYATAVETLDSALQTLPASEEAPQWMLGMVLSNYWDARVLLGERDAARQSLLDWSARNLPGAPEESSAEVAGSLGLIALFDERYGDAQLRFSQAAERLGSVYGPGHPDVVFFRERASFSSLLADSNAKLPEQLGDPAIHATMDEAKLPDGSTGLEIGNQRLSLTPYLAAAHRRAWFERTARAFPDHPLPDRLLWHTHLLLRALAAHLAGLEAPARDALGAANATNLYDTPAARSNRQLQSHLSAYLVERDDGRCETLRDALESAYSVELVIIGRGLSCRTSPDVGRQERSTSVEQAD